VQTEAEIRVWVADGLANGLRPRFTKFSGTLRDRRWLKVVEDIYNRLYRAEPYLNGAWRVEVKANGRFANPPLTLIPSYPDLPMEQVFPRVEKTDVAEVYLREIGPSRIVYFPWDIDRVFWEVLCVDHGKLLRNAIEWATNEERPATVTGPGVLDVTVWRQKDSMTVHLRQSHQSDDDERAVPRTHSDRRAEGAREIARRHEGSQGPTVGQGTVAARRRIAGTSLARRPRDPRPRSRGHSVSYAQIPAAFP
jgi:hypothetical protein